MTEQLSRTATRAQQPAARRWLEWEDTGNVVLVTFLSRQMLSDQEIIDTFDALERLVEETGHRRLILDFRGVEAFASYAVGRLISLHNGLHGAGGRLALCRLRPVVAEILNIMGLWRKFHVYDTEHEALQSFS